MNQPSKTIGILALTQIVSWGSLFYAFTIMAPVSSAIWTWRPSSCSVHFPGACLSRAWLQRPSACCLIVMVAAT